MLCTKFVDFAKNILGKALSILFCLLALSNSPLLASEDEFVYTEEPTHKQELNVYIESFCKNRGRSYVRIQNSLVVDCLSSDTLWKVEYADNWPQALVKAMAYPIYDDYRGEDQYAPKPGVALVHEDADDYRNMVELKQLVQHYKLPLKVEAIENYSPAPTSLPTKTIKNFQIIDFGKKFFGN